MKKGETEVQKTLGVWLGKAKKIGDPPAPGETRGSLERAEPSRMVANDAFTQINFRILQSTRRRIRQLAARDDVTLVELLHRMLDLYEKEHGALERK